MTTEREALDRIAVLCDRWAFTGTVGVHDLRVILAEVTPEAGVLDPHYDPRYELGYRDGLRAQPGCTLDRDQAREVLWWFRAHPSGVESAPEALNALAGCVRPAALAAVTPEPGVTLTPEETALALSWFRGDQPRDGWSDADTALAARLEATR